jgi:hypothetical protein
MNNKKCLVPDCHRHPTARGLCHICYNIALKMVKRGETTWEQLAASGKALQWRGKAKTLQWFRQK